MQRLTLTLLLVTCNLYLQAQNLVPNGSFEDYNTCPNSYAQVARCNGWHQYTYATPDYFHSCCTTTNSFGVPANVIGTQAAASGNAYVGIMSYTNDPSFANYREYVQRSIPPLIPGASYEVSISASLSDKSHFAGDGLGVYFFDNGPAYINNFHVLPVIPQISYNTLITDKLNWTRLIDTFTADSAYNNIVIGGFKNDANISTIYYANAFNDNVYYYIDSVVVRLIHFLHVNYSNTQLCRGDVIYVPYTASVGSYNTGNIFTLQLSDAAGSFASPTNIGTANSTSSGTIQGTIPPNIAAGNGYRLRLVSSNIPDTSADNGANIQIKPLPNISAATSNSPVCAGNTLTLGVTANTGCSFSWTGPSFTSSQQNPAIINPTPANSGDYIVTANLNGCIDKDTINILVKPTPVITAIANNGPLCAGNTLYLNALSDIGTSFNWTGPSFTSSQQNPVLSNVAVSNQGTYSVTASYNGCTSAVSGTTVVINPIPATPTVSSNTPVCINSDILLFASGNPAATYNWTGPSFNSNVQNPIINNVNMSMAGNYSVSATLNGCTSPTVGTNVSVLYSPASVAMYALPGDTICLGANINFVAVASNGGSTPLYQWLKNGQPITGANNISYNATGLQTGDRFSVILTPSTNCSFADTSVEQEVEVLPYVTPSVNITATPGAFISPWQMVTFHTTVLNGGPKPGFQWKRNSQNVNGAIYDTWGAYTLADNDTIWVEMKSNAPCPAPATVISNKIVIHLNTGVYEGSKENGFNIYPNPNKGTFVVTGDVPNDEPLHITILNQVGQIVYETEVLPRNNNLQAEISISHELPHGVYLLQIKSSSTFAVEKIAVE